MKITLFIIICRSCSEESVHFSKMMLNPQASDADKYNALMNAIRGKCYNSFATSKFLTKNFKDGVQNSS